MLLHTAASTHRSIFTEQQPSDVEPFTQMAFAHGLFVTGQLLHPKAFTNRSFYTGKPLHRAAFTHGSDWFRHGPDLFRHGSDWLRHCSDWFRHGSDTDLLVISTR